MSTDKPLLLVALAVALAVITWFWPWEEFETFWPVIGIAGYALKSWAPVVYAVFLAFVIIVLLRKSLFR